MKIIFQALNVLIFTLFISVTAIASETDGKFTTLRVGVLDSHPMAKRADYKDAFVFNYSNLLGIDVSVTGFKTLGSLIDAHASGRIHYAMHTARSFATTDSICKCVDAIARPVSQTGAVGFRSVLVSKKDLDVRGNTAKANLKIGYSRKESISGWLMPNMALSLGQLGKFDLEEMGDVSTMISAFGNDELHGFFGWLPVSSTDVEFTQSDLFSGYFGNDVFQPSDTDLSWWSNIVYFGPHAVHNDVPEKLRQDLTDLLLNMDSQQPSLLDIVEPYYSGGFTKSNQSDYDALTKALAIKAGIAVPEVELELSLRPSIIK
jgi:phosphonate transport system substrate-binding protein